MKIMMLLLFLFLLVPIVNATLREGGCSVGETEMFSIYQRGDSHISQPGFFNLSICYPGEINVTLRDGNCNTNESFILSLFKPNDTHIASSQGYYNYSLCIEGTTCEIGTTCYREHKIITLNRVNNSHIGEYLYYPIGLCCGTRVSGLSGVEILPPVIKEEVEVIIEVVEVVKKVPLYAWLAVGVLFFLGWKRRKKRCYECKKKLKKKTLTLYDKKYYCKKCFKKLAEKGPLRINKVLGRFINT